MPTLDWIGKKAVLNHHREVPYRLLHAEPELSFGDPNSGNLLVEGDNLLALKALLPYYAGKVKCVYIDPPYNTGEEKWVYNDAVNSPEIRAWLGNVVGRKSEDLSRRDKWLCMMYPRLRLLLEFLAEDGVIMASIDDNELPDLLALMHELFGEQNHLATLVWEKGKKGDATFFSVRHEYVLVYARSKASLVARGTRFRLRKPGVDGVLVHYQELRQELGKDHEAIRARMMAWYRSLPAGDPRRQHRHYTWSDDRGLYFAADFAGPDDGRENRPRYDIIHPVTGRACRKPSTGWRWDPATTARALEQDPPLIHFGPDERTIPCRKTYLFETVDEPFQSVFYKDGRAATRELEALLGRKSAFPYPKDTDVLADLIGLVSDRDSIVLDSFAGAGATGHAVAKLNRADGGSRRFVLVELDKAVCLGTTLPRLRLVLADAGEGSRPPGGLQVCRLGEPLFDDNGSIRREVSFGDLAAHVYFAEQGTPIPRKATGKSPLLGACNGTAVYLLFNGVLHDKRPRGGNVLTAEVLRNLPPCPEADRRVVYGEGCRLGAARLSREGITFKHIPYDIKVS